MPKFRITAPDGKSYEVTAPDGATQDEVLAYAQAHYQQPEAAPKAWQPTPRSNEDLHAMAGKGTAAEDMSGLEQFGTGIAKTGRDLVLGGAQSALEGGPSGQFARWAAGKIGGDLSNPIADPLDRYVTGQITQARQADRELNNTHAGLAGNIVGNVLTAFAPGTVASKAGQLPRAAKYGLAALTGAAYGDVTPVADGESRGLNVGAGAALGVGGQKIANVLEASGAKAAAAITPELRKLYEYAKAKGINLTPAQLSDSAFVKRLSLMLDRLPFSGATARAQKQQAAGNDALAGLIGEKGVVDQNAMAHAAQKLGAKFDKVFAAGAKYDTQFLREVAMLKQQADAQLDETARRTINGWIDRIKTQAQGGNMPPRVLQGLDRAARMAATGGGDRQQIAQAFREALHENFSRNAPKAVKAEWDQARKQYAIMKTLEPVVARNPEGGIPLQQVQGAINASKAGRTRRARGNDGELGQIASVGQRMKQASSSGTAENLQAAGLGAGALANLPATLFALSGGSLGARALNSKGLAALMMRQNPGAFRQDIAPFIPGGFLGLTPMAAAANEQPAPKPKR